MKLDYERMISRQQRGMLYLLVILVIGAGFAPYPAIFFGLLLGTAISMYNHYLLQRKVADYAEKVEKQEKPKGLGMVSRIAAVVLGVLIVLRNQDYFHPIAFIVGLMASYLIILVDIIAIAIIDLFGRGEKKGE